MRSAGDRRRRHLNRGAVTTRRLHGPPGPQPHSPGPGACPRPTSPEERSLAHGHARERASGPGQASGRAQATSSPSAARTSSSRRSSSPSATTSSRPRGPNYATWTRAEQLHRRSRREPSACLPPCQKARGDVPRSQRSFREAASASVIATETPASDENQPSTGTKSASTAAPASVESGRHALAIAFHATGHCGAQRAGSCSALSHLLDEGRPVAVGDAVGGRPTCCRGARVRFRRRGRRLGRGRAGRVSSARG